MFESCGGSGIFIDMTVTGCFVRPPCELIAGAEQDITMAAQFPDALDNIPSYRHSVTVSTDTGKKMTLVSKEKSRHKGIVGDESSKVRISVPDALSGQSGDLLSQFHTDSGELIACGKAAFETEPLDDPQSSSHPQSGLASYYPVVAQQPIS